MTINYYSIISLFSLLYPMYLLVGLFANDLAYDMKEMLSQSQETYERNANTKNILELLWRLEDKNGCIIPTWPVVMLTKDVLITNTDYPIEIGLSYSYRYWKSMEQQISNGR